MRTWGYEGLFWGIARAGCSGQVRLLELGPDAPR